MLKLNKVYRKKHYNGTVDFVMPIKQFKNGNFKCLVVYLWPAIEIAPPRTLEFSKAYVETFFDMPFSGYRQTNTVPAEVKSNFKSKLSRVSR